MQTKIGSTVNMTKIMLLRYFEFKKSRLVLVFLSIIIGSASISSLTSVYLDIDIKMRRELRAYGANVIMRKASGAGADASDASRKISHADLAVIMKTLDKKKVVAASPYLYGIAESNKSRFAVAGVDLKEFAKLSPYVRTIKSAKEQIDDAAIIGKRLAEVLGVQPGDKLILRNSLDKNKTLKRTVVSIIESGDDLDDQLITDIRSAGSFLGSVNSADYFAVSYAGTSEDVGHINKSINKRLPDVKAMPINKVSRSEAAFLRKISALTLFVSIAILISAILATAITLISMIFERRQEIGVKKALGASNKDIMMELAGESLLTGIIGGIIGWAAGTGMAQIIGASLFGSYISVRPLALVLTLIVSLFIAGVAAIFPSRMVLKVEPAQVLRNE